MVIVLSEKTVQISQLFIPQSRIISEKIENHKI